LLVLDDNPLKTEQVDSAAADQRQQRAIIDGRALLAWH